MSFRSLAVHLWLQLSVIIKSFRLINNSFYEPPNASVTCARETGYFVR